MPPEWKGALIILRQVDYLSFIVKEMKVTVTMVSFGYFIATFMSALLSIMAVSVVFWAKQSSDNDDNYYGIFLRESADKQVESMCNSGMTEMECGYLKSAKACSVISIIFGGAACLMYMASCGDTGFGFYSFSMGTVGFIQSIFGLMCVVIFSYFKESYLTSNDDVNIEYPDHAEVAPVNCIHYHCDIYSVGGIRMGVLFTHSLRCVVLYIIVSLFVPCSQTATLSQEIPLSRGLVCYL